MAVELEEHVYGFTGTGKKVRIGHVHETEADLFPVGGTIFWIDPDSDEEVEFFDQYGDLIPSVSIGDKPFAYRVTSQGQAARTSIMSITTSSLRAKDGHTTRTERMSTTRSEQRQALARVRRTPRS